VKETAELVIVFSIFFFNVFFSVYFYSYLIFFVLFVGHTFWGQSDPWRTSREVW